MNEYDIWTGLTSFTLLNYFGAIAIVSAIIWAFGGFRKDKK